MVPTPVVGCELDSRGVERIVGHAQPEGSASPITRIDKTRQMQNGYGSYRPNNAMVNSPIRTQYPSNQTSGSGASSSSSTDRAGSYIIDQRRHNENSLCGSEPYTDSGIEKADSNHLEEEQRFLREDDVDMKMIAAHEQQFGTFGRPGISTNHHQSNNHHVRSATMDPRASYRQPIPNSSTMGVGSSSQPRPARSEESISAPIFQPMGPYVKSKRGSQSSRGKLEKSSFCPDWRCILLCNMVIIILLVAAFLVSYYYVWPVFVLPLVEKTRPVDGAWTQWTSWSECSVTCGGGGWKAQYRFCADPPAEDGGAECEGEAFYNMTCSAPVACPDCSRKCETGTLSKDCTRCTCEDHEITGIIRDEQDNPIAGASLYKYGHYDKVGETDRGGRYRIKKVCANSKDNILLVTQKGFNPVDIWPKTSTNDPRRAAADGILKRLLEPKITTQPQSKTRYMGQGAKLCCSATDNNSSTLEVRWYKDGQLIPEGESSYTQTDTNLKLVNLTESDQGNYICEASNRAGLDVSPKAQITVKDSSWNSCNTEPLQEWYILPPNCEEQKVNTGKCNENPAEKARCLHVDQFQEISQSQCLDTKSEYCCGPTETQEVKVKCKTPGATSFYSIPVIKKLSCGCVKCSSLQ